MPVKIKECALDDENAFSRLFSIIERQHRKALPRRFRRPPHGYPERSLKRTLSDRLSKIFIAELDGEVVGYACLRVKAWPNHPIFKPGKYLSIEELVVAPKARRQGIGRRLMAHVEKFAKKRGYRQVELHVWGFNRAAEAFYEGLGYKTSRRHLSKDLK